jgi:hypothetical protein
MPAAWRPVTRSTRLSRKTFPVAHRKVGDKTLFHIEAVSKFIDGLPTLGPRGRGRPPKAETGSTRNVGTS